MTSKPRRNRPSEQAAKALLQVLGWYHGSARLDEPKKHRCDQGHETYFNPCQICIALTHTPPRKESRC